MTKPQPSNGPGPQNMEAKSKVAGDTGGEHSGRQIQGGQPDDEKSRGASQQGPKQDARGGPAGASQGGAPRGASRLEPSHQHEQQKKDRVTKDRD
jgi:hypothetical protein